MASISSRRRRVHLRVAYMGLLGSGVRENLRHLAETYPNASAYHSRAMPIHRAATLESFSAELVALEGFAVHVTFVGVVLDQAPPTAIGRWLRTLDGVVFVAESAPRAAEATMMAYERLRAGMAQLPPSRPLPALIIQWNGRDHPQALPIDALRALLDTRAVPWESAVADQSVGVWDTQLRLLRMCLTPLQLYGLPARRSRGPFDVATEEDPVSGPSSAAAPPALAR